MAMGQQENPYKPQVLGAFVLFSKQICLVPGIFDPQPKNRTQEKQGLGLDMLTHLRF